MLGLAIFHLLVIAFVAVNALTDRGVAERRKIKSDYGWLLGVMAEFEQAGGCVQELDDQAATARRMMRKFVVLPWVFALLVTVGMVWLGLAAWIPASLVALYVIAAGALSWLISDLFGLVDGRRPSSKSEIAAALFALGLKGVIVAVGIVTAARGVAQVNAGAWLSGIALLVLSIALVTYCYLPVAIVDRRLQKLKEVSFANTTKTDAVLFLRSFGDDDLRLYSPYGSLGPRYRFIPGRKRFEELLTSALVGRSELVGVGKPGEKLPMLGASRTYWDHENWKDAIRSTASRTDALLVLAGQTPSLSWEMAQLSELGLLGKTLIVFPPDNEVGTIERYAYIDEALEFEPQHKLPDDLKVTLIAVAFDLEGRPVHYVSGGRDWAAYIATLVHFQMVLDGDLQFEAEGSVSQAVAMAENPFDQAAYLLDAGDRDLAESVLKDATIDPSDASGLIGRAWEKVALHGDFAGARTLLLSLAASEDEAMVDRALAAIDAAEGGGHSRDILRARYPERFQNRTDRISVGTAKLDRVAGLRFQRLMRRIGSAEEVEDREAAYNGSRDLLASAEGEAISTLVAMARVQLGDAEFQLGNLERASALFSQAAALRGAPRVEISAILPRVEPTDIVAEALGWLVRVADQQNDVEKRNFALQQLFDFRTEYGPAEDAAWAAQQLGKSYGAAGDLDAARRHFDQAYSEYTRVGRLSEAGWIKYWLAKVESQQGSFDAAMGFLEQAVRIASTADDPPLGFEAHRLAGELQGKLGRKSADVELLRQARASYESALDVAREVARASERRKAASPEDLRESQLNVSIALSDLGSFVQEEDPATAHEFYRAAASIRRGLTEQVPNDYWLNRRLAFSLLYLAVNSRRLETAEGPGHWREGVTTFAKLTEHPGDNKTAASDFRGSIDRFLEDPPTNGSRSAEIAALAPAIPAILRALAQIVEQAPPDEAYKATRSLFGLATEFERDSRPVLARDLYAGVIAARRLLSEASPDDRLFVRGLAYSLLGASSRFLPESPETAIVDFREAIAIFSQLADSADSDNVVHAQKDLLRGWMHATDHMSRVSHTSLREFAGGAIQVARHLMSVGPTDPSLNRDLSWALRWRADSLASDDTAAALGDYQAIIDLNLAEGVPRNLHWHALTRSGHSLGKTDPLSAVRFFDEASRFARAELESNPEDDWEWRLGRSLAWAAEAENPLDLQAALAKWRECIALQERRIKTYPTDFREVRLLAVALNNVGELVGTGDIDSALDLYRRSDTYFREVVALDPDNPERLRDIVVVGADLAELLTSVSPPHHEASAAWAQVAKDVEALAEHTELTERDEEVLAKVSSYLSALGR